MGVERELNRANLLKADVLRFNSFQLDQKSVLIHPRFMSPGRVDIFVQVFRSNVLSKPCIKGKLSCNTSHSSKHFSTVNIVDYVYCLLTFKKRRKTLTFVGFQLYTSELLIDLSNRTTIRNA